MNLAEIRRKAQRGEQAESPQAQPAAVAVPQQAPPQAEAPAQLFAAEPQAPAQAAEPEAAQPSASAQAAEAPPAAPAEATPAAAAAPAPATAAPAPAPPAPAAAPAPPEATAPAPAPTAELTAETKDFEWRPEPLYDMLPSEFAFPVEPDRFDPAAVILSGRESAALDEEVAFREEAGAASMELLCFKVGQEEYAISIMDIKEIIKPREVTEVPRVPSFVRGVLSLRGIIIPIFDMRVRLGLPGAAHSERERVIVVGRQGSFCGVLVDEVVQVVRIPEAGVEPPPVVLEGIDRDFVQGIGRVGGRMLILLDMGKVLDVSLA